jgi:hypothetical protein
LPIYRIGNAVLPSSGTARGGSNPVVLIELKSVELLPEVSDGALTGDGNEPLRLQLTIHALNDLVSLAAAYAQDILNFLRGDKLRFHGQPSFPISIHASFMRLSWNHF